MITVAQTRNRLPHCSARDAIRFLKAGGELTEPVTVFVRQGNYPLEKTLTLGEQDSGTEAAPIVYRAYEKEKPVLVGGREIKGFTSHREGILKADVKALGLADAGVRVLTFDGQRQELARYPNCNPKAVGGGDWAYVDGTRYSMYTDSPDEDNYLKQNQHLDFWQRNIPRLTQTLLVKPARRPSVASSRTGGSVYLSAIQLGAFPAQGQIV